jgi:arylsulfatase A-like enzyme
MLLASLAMVVIAFTALASMVPASARAGAKVPRLVVLLSVDQMRADYVEQYGDTWRGGLHRLLTTGAVYTQARYPYLNTITCAGHSTYGTGAFPHRHGMILNSWWSRELKRGVECTEDAGSPAVHYGPTEPSPGHSARSIAVPTLADALKAALVPRPRVVSFSLKARSAIGMVGSAGDLVTWFDTRSWSSSQAFASPAFPLPSPLVAKVIAAHPEASLVATAWTKVGPERAYRNSDDAPAERPPLPTWSRTFPHPLAIPPGTRVASVELPPLAAWSASPMTDQMLLAFAKAALSELKLGRGKGTDVLAVSFSALDIVGHAFGPRSHEVQDVLLRLDRLLGDLLTTLDRTVGKDRYLVALTSDHGVATYPEQLVAEGQDAGRIDMGAVNKQLGDRLNAELGAGKHIANLRYTDLYLAPGVYDRLRGLPGALERAKAAVAGVKGVAAVFSADDLRAPAALDDPARRPAALSYFPGRSGDLVLVPRNNWLTTATGTTHGSSNAYDQRVPLVLFGAGIKKGRFDTPSSPADVAPTLAALLGASLPTAEGHVLGNIVEGARPAQKALPERP